MFLKNAWTVYTCNSNIFSLHNTHIKLSMVCVKQSKYTSNERGQSYQYDPHRHYC